MSRGQGIALVATIGAVVTSFTDWDKSDAHGRLGVSGAQVMHPANGIAVILSFVFVAITAGTRRRTPALAVLLVLLAGCGSGDKKANPASAQASPTPPPSEQLKYDLLTAAIQLDAYKLSEHTFTDDETKLGAAFPPTVTIKSADATSFYMAAYDNKHIRYVLRRTGDVTERTCDPPDDEVCPDGEW